MVNTEQPKFTEDQVAAAEKQIVEQSRRIEFYITEYTIEILAIKMSNGDFEVPNYQREDTWEDKRKSRFIESVLMGLPIPFLFFWESPETGRLEIVDGSQRLRTIEQFILGDFCLGDLDQLSLLPGFRFKDLPESRQRKVKNRSIRGIVLSEHTDEQSRFDLFERINTSSKIANKAEVRRGALRGPFQDLVESLSQESFFVALAPISEKQKKEREREELVTRFFAYGDGLENYKDQVSPFLYEYTKRMNAHFEQKPKDVEAYRQRFNETMEFVRQNFPWGFRRTVKGKATPRARFEAIAIGSYYALQQKPEIAKQSCHAEDWHDSQELRKITGADGANAIGRLRGRINFVRDRLLGE
ncbi:MAG: DUF262 domain-containing protein [Symploca sp. SIO2E9]|nr:DUF262 domain-containing protein [Symploca sp. SIO2E9]